MKNKPCPFCDSRKIDAEELGEAHFLHCRNCGATGPDRPTWPEAIEAWNNRPKRHDGDGKH